MLPSFSLRYLVWCVCIAQTLLISYHFHCSKQATIISPNFCLWRSIDFSFLTLNFSSFISIWRLSQISNRLKWGSVCAKWGNIASFSFSGKTASRTGHQRKINSWGSPNIFSSNSPSGRAFVRMQSNLSEIKHIAERTIWRDARKLFSESFNKIWKALCSGTNTGNSHKCFSKFFQKSFGIWRRMQYHYSVPSVSLEEEREFFMHQKSLLSSLARTRNKRHVKNLSIWRHQK